MSNIIFKPHPPDMQRVLLGGRGRGALLPERVLWDFKHSEGCMFVLREKSFQATRAFMSLCVFWLAVLCVNLDVGKNGKVTCHGSVVSVRLSTYNRVTLLELEEDLSCEAILFKAAVFPTSISKFENFLLC
jgi:hypothetical protein